MSTRAALLNTFGAVHRVIVGSDGSDETACGQQCKGCAPVTLVQALVYARVISECPACWDGRRWRQWVHGSAA